MKNERRILTPKEVEESINNTKGIWAIEGMEMLPEEENIFRDFLAGKITKEELEAHFFRHEE